jgi:hypothetical protein
MKRPHKADDGRSADNEELQAIIDVNVLPAELSKRDSAVGTHQDAVHKRTCRNDAHQLVRMFLSSVTRVKLGKCRKCFRYEIKARKPYKQGTYCRRCKAKTSAGIWTRALSELQNNSGSLPRASVPDT